MVRDDPPEQHRRRRLLITLTATGLVVAVLAGIGVYGLLTGPRTTPAPDPTTAAPSTATPTASATPDAGRLARLPRTMDSEAYARAVAAALFDWDTHTLVTRDDHREVLLAGADPSGVESAGLVRDLDGYLPSADTWRRLRDYRTAQHLEITTIAVPAAWADALTTGKDTIPEGTVAYTIDGIRHRTGTWQGEPVTSTHPVAFTVFLVCPPAGTGCHLLRLSIPDTPLR